MTALPQPPRISPPRRWWPSLLVVLVLLVTVFGGYLVAEALEGPVGPPVTVADTVRVRPLSGWESARTYSGDGFQGASLTRGSGNLDVVVIDAGPGGVAGYATRYVDEGLRPNAQRLSVSEELELVGLAAGLDGVRFSYVGVFERGGAPIEGEVTVVVASTGNGVVFDAWGPEGQLGLILGDAHTMEDGAVIR
ncbi:MAG: hypothetical protein WEA10_11075 [Actinomycetota bacterium]